MLLAHIDAVDFQCCRSGCEDQEPKMSTRYASALPLTTLPILDNRFLAAKLLSLETLVRVDICHSDADYHASRSLILIGEAQSLKHCPGPAAGSRMDPVAFLVAFRGALSHRVQRRRPIRMLSRRSLKNNGFLPLLRSQDYITYIVCITSGQY